MDLLVDQSEAARKDIGELLVDEGKDEGKDERKDERRERKNDEETT